jgi:hypothetical protein
MNWQRGLRRTWLVLTLLWISFTTWVMGPIDQYRHLGDPVRFLLEQTIS